MKQYKSSKLIIAGLAVLLVSALSIVFVNRVMADAGDDDAASLTKEEYLERMGERYDAMMNRKSITDMPKEEFLKMNEEMFDLKEKYGINRGMHGMMGGGMMGMMGGGGCPMMGSQGSFRGPGGVMTN